MKPMRVTDLMKRDVVTGKTVAKTVVTRNENAAISAA